MAGRRRISRPRRRPAPRSRQKPTSELGKLLQERWLDVATVMDLNGMAVSGDTAVRLVDNSVDFTNSIVKFTKLTVTYYQMPEDSANWSDHVVLVGLFKRDEDDTVVPQWDDVESIRELKNKGDLYRGPWLLHTDLFSSNNMKGTQGRFKTLVLTDIVLDREEDLLFGLTNLGPAHAAAQHRIAFFQKGFFRVVK